MSNLIIQFHRKSNKNYYVVILNNIIISAVQLDRVRVKQFLGEEGGLVTCPLKCFSRNI